MLGKFFRGRGQPDQLDVFVSARNIALYRKLLDERTDTDQRQTIIGLLQAEMVKLRGRSNDNDASASAP